MSDILREKLQYPVELDEIEAEEAQDIAPIVQCLGLRECRTKEQLLTALGNWHRHTSAKLDGKQAELKEIIEAADAEASYYKNKLAFIKRCIESILPPGAESEFVNQDVSLTYRRSERCVVDDVESVPIEYCKLETVPQIEKIKEALKAGGDVPGAKLTEHFNLQVKPGGDRAKNNQQKRLKKQAQMVEG